MDEGSDASGADDQRRGRDQQQRAAGRATPGEAAAAAQGIEPALHPGQGTGGEQDAGTVADGEQGEQQGRAGPGPSAACIQATPSTGAIQAKAQGPSARPNTRPRPRAVQGPRDFGPEAYRRPTSSGAASPADRARRRCTAPPPDSCWRPPGPRPPGPGAGSPPPGAAGSAARPRAKARITTAAAPLARPVAACPVWRPGSPPPAARRPGGRGSSRCWRSPRPGPPGRDPGGAGQGLGQGRDQVHQGVAGAPSGACRSAAKRSRIAGADR